MFLDTPTSQYQITGDFHIFSCSLIISSHRIPPIAILYILIGAIPQVHHLRRGKEQAKKATKRHRKETCSQESDISHTNSSMYFFLQLRERTLSMQEGEARRVLQIFQKIFLNRGDHRPKYFMAQYFFQKIFHGPPHQFQFLI